MKLTDSKIKIDIETAGVKKCKKCEEEYPATLGYFYQAKGNVGGLTHICKRCSDNKQYRKRIEDLRSLENVKEVEQKLKEKTDENKDLKFELRKTQENCELIEKHRDSLGNEIFNLLDKQEKLKNKNLVLTISSLLVLAASIIYFFKQR